MSARRFAHLALLFVLAAPAARAQAPRTPDLREILLKSGVVVPAPSRIPEAAAHASPRHLIIQFERDSAEPTLAALDARGVRVLGWVPRNAVSAFVPAGFDPLSIPGVRWAGALQAHNKVAPNLDREQSRVTVLVDFFPDVKAAIARKAVIRAGGLPLFHRSLRVNTLLVTIDREDLAALAQRDEVSFIYPASNALAQDLPVNACPGAMTDGLVIPNFASSGDGWDGPGLGSAQLRYFFANGTPDSANEHAEVVQALGTWSRFAAITWSAVSSARQARTLDFLWASGAHGDGNPFDGPGQVLAHASPPAPPGSEPEAGDVHFDEDEFWQSGAGVDVFTVALHEIGHALGLDHSSDPNAVMYPYYAAIVADLAPDDIAGIRALYAPAIGGPLRDPYEPDDAAGSANPIQAGARQTRSIAPIGDLDFARFTLLEAADVVIETSGVSDDTQLWLYDANLALVAFDDDSGVGSFSRIARGRLSNDPLPPGDYIVLVEEKNNDAPITSYSLSLQIVYHSEGDAYEPNSSEASATPLVPGTPQVHSILPVGDHDYFVFSLNQTSEIAIETSGASGDTQLWLMRPGMVSFDYDDDDGPGEFSRIDRTEAEANLVTPGTYYVLIVEKGHDETIANYDLLLTVVPRPDLEDAYEENDQWSRPWGGGVNWEGTWLSSIAGPGVQRDFDFYRIDVSPGSERVVIDLRFLHSDGDIDLSLAGSGGWQMAASEGVGDSESIDFTVPLGGGSHLILVSGDHAGNTYDLWWDDVVPNVPPPSNDDFENRWAVGGDYPTGGGHNRSATKQPGEPNHAGGIGGRSMWWSWTPYSDRDVRITTELSTVDTLLAVYTGTRVDQLTLVAENDDAATDLSSAVAFRASGGVEYSIALDAQSGGDGRFSFQLLAPPDEPPPPPPPPPPALQALWSSFAHKCKASSGVCKLKGSVLLRNTSASSSAPTQVSFYFSGDAIYDPSDRLIASAPAAALSPGRSRKLKLKAKRVAGDVHGNFVLAVVGDPSNGHAVAVGPVP